MTGTNQI